MKLKRIAAWSVGAVCLALLLTGTVAWFRSDNSCSAADPGAPHNPMKAVIYCDYGSPEVLAVKDVEKPVPTDSQVLIRVRAVSVNPLDWHFMEGSPYFARLMMGLRKPSDVRLGTDFSGVVEAIGKSVTQFKPGDEVFGGRTGAFAQYVTAPARNVVLKPANLTFEQAAAVPVAAITALQGLRDGGKIQAGQKVLINGASGGVGTFAVQIAKSFGANVTGVCSTRNVDMVRSLGADQVIDYTKDDFTKRAERYDLILDNVVNHPLRKVKHVLNPQGAYVMIGGGSGKWVGPLPRLLQAIVMNKFVSQDLRFFLADLNQKDLLLLRDLLESGKVKPVIDRQYPFKELPEAMRYLEEGHARAKVVVTID